MAKNSSIVDQQRPALHGAARERHEQEKTDRGRALLLMRATARRRAAAGALFALALLLPQQTKAGIDAHCGRASWYEFTTQTANGEQADPDTFTAAHPTLPFGVWVRVENLANGRSVEVRINDRGPQTGGRIIDITRSAAKKLGMLEAGVARVRVTPLGAVGAEAECP